MYSKQRAYATYVGYALSKEGSIMDYYRILGVPEQADEEQIKQAYRREAKKYHPDLNPDDPAAEARFKEIVEAYAVLCDSKKRREYDSKNQQRAGRAGTRPKGQARAADPEMDLADLTKNMERYFGFPFQAKKTAQAGQGAQHNNKKNPLDMTEMFEAYMRLK